MSARGRPCCQQSFCSQLQPFGATFCVFRCKWRQAGTLFAMPLTDRQTDRRFDGNVSRRRSPHKERDNTLTATVTRQTTPSPWNLVGTSRCCRSCAYTHLVHAHFSARGACTITFAHFLACAHTRMAQVMSKRCLSHMSLSISPSPLSCFTRLCCSCTLTSTSRSCPSSCPVSAGHAHLRTCTEKFGYLTKSDANTGRMSKKQKEKRTIVESFCQANFVEAEWHRG